MNKPIDRRFIPAALKRDWHPSISLPLDLKREVENVVPPRELSRWVEQAIREKLEKGVK